MSKKESLVEYILKMLLQVLVNFSMGLIMALVVSLFLRFCLIWSWILFGVIIFANVAYLKTRETGRCVCISQNPFPHSLTMITYGQLSYL